MAWAMLQGAHMETTNSLKWLRGLIVIVAALWSLPSRADVAPTCSAFDDLITCDAQDVGKACQGGGQCYAVVCGTGMTVYKCDACPAILSAPDAGCAPSKFGTPCGDGGTCSSTQAYCNTSSTKFVCAGPAPAKPTGPPAGEGGAGGGSATGGSGGAATGGASGAGGNSGTRRQRPGWRGRIRRHRRGNRERRQRHGRHGRRRQRQRHRRHRRRLSVLQERRRLRRRATRDRTGRHRARTNGGRTARAPLRSAPQTRALDRCPAAPSHPRGRSRI